MTRILLVEDDEGIGDPLSRALAGQGYDVAWERTAAGTIARIEAGFTPDLALLDLGLPDMDGVALCRRIRPQIPSAVVVMLTARDTELDVVLGLESGADDYLTKPFRFTELMARLRAHLRRGGVSLDPESGDLTVGQVHLDRTARRLEVDGAEVDLRPKEFELLTVLLEAAGRAVSRDELMERVWDENWFGSTKTLDLHIGTLRKKLEAAGVDPVPLTTLRGFGYRYETDAVGD